jgi:tRNA A37 threonylcarbamoyladenosine synthetase subunit TsaC/SUA5/YrdC
MSVSLVPVNENLTFEKAEDIYEAFGKQVDLVIGGEGVGVIPTTVISLLDGQVEILREGKGDVAAFANW